MNSKTTDTVTTSPRRRRAKRSFWRLFMVFWATWVIICVVIWPFIIQQSAASWKLYADGFRDVETALSIVLWLTGVPLLFAVIFHGLAETITWVRERLGRAG